MQTIVDKHYAWFITENKQTYPCTEDHPSYTIYGINNINYIKQGQEDKPDIIKGIIGDITITIEINAQAIKQIGRKIYRTTYINNIYREQTWYHNAGIYIAKQNPKQINLENIEITEPYTPEQLITQTKKQIKRQLIHEYKDLSKTLKTTNPKPTQTRQIEL